ncbi:phosphatase PAP2 family protein [Ferdinandcohnia quinoae]|uniref:Phosphatase PAP2 family protein n=1 Tax=Fredinandcohnia quinoae TaxID=2918902 RepID=A0AAW5E3V1_9BACI|nr:phosphatase PAP2 family protein [Fredinandcohnia sp. SECRCQ15]MCH1624026.1 phosphatase PAP2 family protein [Fredinandcohnia sp. SECRCQ15]
MQQRNTTLLLFFLLLLSITVGYTIIIVNDVFYTIDTNVEDMLASWSSPILERVMEGITFLAYTKMLALLSAVALIWLLIKKLYIQIIFFLLLMGGGVILTLVMKLTIERDRPDEITYIDFWGFGNNIISYSYPSGHAVKGFLFFGFLIYLIHRKMNSKGLEYSLTVFFVTLIVLIGIGQILLNRHYVSDVLGGYLIAITWFMFCFIILRSNKIRKSKVFFFDRKTFKGE